MEYIIDKNGQVQGIENCYKFKFKPEDYPNMVFASWINSPIDFTIQNKEQGSTKATIVPFIEACSIAALSFTLRYILLPSSDISETGA